MRKKQGEEVGAISKGIKQDCYFGTGEQNYPSPCTSKTGAFVVCSERLVKICLSLMSLKKKKGGSK